MRHFLWMAVLFALTTELPCQVNPKKEAPYEGIRRAALLVAVDSYQNPELPSIRDGAQNARVIEGLLEEQGYSTLLLANSAATREAILEAIARLKDLTGSGPTQIVLFFSGHYFSHDNERYFLPYDSSRHLEQVTIYAVDFDNVVESLGGAGRTVMAFLDTSWSTDQSKEGAALAQDEMKSLIDRLAAKARPWILSSTGPQSDKEGASSVFSDALTDGLSGKASEADGSVTFESLAQYVETRVNRLEPARLVLTASAPTAFNPIISRNSEYAEVRVYYATDRARSGVTTAGQTYGKDRSPSDKLEFGESRVSIPRDHRIGEFETASILSFRKNPGKTIELLKSTPLSTDSFWSDLGKAISSTEGKQVLIFVHGYRTSFENAVRRTAQLAYDLQFPGPTIAYTWPSDDAPIISYLRYSADEGNVEWTTDHLRYFLEAISSKFPDSTIHIIAHSMGTRAVFNAVRMMPATPKRGSLKEVVLAAPDIDSSVFTRLSTTMLQRIQHATLYANSHDDALKASEGWHGGYSRAGESGRDLVVVTGVDTIDVSQIDTSLLGHSYFADSRSVISDIYNMICLGQAPQKRYGLVPRTDSKGTYWVFKP